MRLNETFLSIRRRGKAKANDRFLLLAAAIGLLAALLILLREINFGVGLAHDSIIYLSVARSLAAGAGLVAYNGDTLTLFPPLFPALVAVPGLFGLDAPAAAGLVNAAAIGALVGVVGWRLRSDFGSTPLALWGALAAMLSIPLAYVGSRAFSEPIFLLLTTLALIQAAQFLDSGRRSALVWAAVFTALACLTRYSGAAIVITVALLLLCRRDSWSSRAQNVVLYSSIAALPVGIWVLRNFLLTGLFTGYRAPSDATLTQNVTVLLHTLASWLFPVGIWSNVQAGTALLAAPLGLPVLALVAGASILAVRQWRAEGQANGALLVPVAFILIYGALLTAAATFTLLDPLEDKLMSPVYVPLLFTVAAIADWRLRRNCGVPSPNSGPDGPEPSNWSKPAAMIRMRTGRLKPALRLAPLVGLFLWLAYPLAANAVDIHRGITEATGWYSNARWANSELPPYLKRHLSGIEYGKLYSNDYWVPYFHAGIPALALPSNRNELRSVYQNPAVAADDGIHVLWIVDPPQAPLEYDVRDLKQALPSPQTLIEGRDGTLFYVSAAGIAESERAAAAAAYAAAQEMGAPAISAVYNVYLDDGRLIYLKEPCVSADIAATFWLHLYPVDTSDLEPQGLEHGYNGLDFEFDRYGRQIGEACVASVPIPNYDIARIHTGQWTDQGITWEARVGFRLSALRRMQLDTLAARKPVASGGFAVYLLDGELAYLKEPCTAADTATPFYLHIVPFNSDDLPAERKEYGFDNLDFVFAAKGWSFDGQCLAVMELPEYDIALIRTGQYTDAGRLWESEFPAGFR